MTDRPDTARGAARFEGLPKAELHVHLEGAIPPDVFWELLRKYGGDGAAPDRAALRRRFVYRDFPHFIDTWVWKNGYLREYDDFRFVAEAVARRFASQNIRYAEVFFSPSDFFRHGLVTGKIAEAIRRGLRAVPAVEIALVADLVRDRGPENAARTLDELRETKDLGITGVTIGGSEHAYPPEPFAAVFEKARGFGFRTSAHAGEAAGAESVRGALEALRVDRIGHGTRAAEDEDLIDTLAASGVPLELCPLSNVRTRVVASVADHPARRFFERGIPISINTDDPAMFQTSLALEYDRLVAELGFTEDEIRGLILGAIRSSWLPEDRKAMFIKEFQEDPAWGPLPK